MAKGRPIVGMIQSRKDFRTMKHKKQPPPPFLYSKGDYLFNKIAGWE